jgi:hypothetical protein
MQFSAKVRVFKVPPDSVSLRGVWDIDHSELAPNGASTLEHLEAYPEPMQTVYRNVCWQGQALIEFQDLQDMPFPHNGRFMNLGYLYCESLNALRQVVICAVNGQTHAALAALRSSLEAMVYHYWWRRKLFLADDYEAFYNWLFGKERNTRFGAVITDTLNDLPRPEHAVVFDELQPVYSQLCSYAHKATLDEAITRMRGGNVRQQSDHETIYWLSMLGMTQRCMLDIAILSNPHALFPVDIYRKFGFNPPLGVFLDQFSGYYVGKALGESAQSAYREHFKNIDPPSTQMAWYEEFPDLTDEEVLATWHEEAPNEPSNSSFEDKLLRRAASMKAKVRAMLWSFSYMQDTPEMPDIRELVRILGETLSKDAEEST